MKARLYWPLGLAAIGLAVPLALNAEPPKTRSKEPFLVRSDEGLVEQPMPGGGTSVNLEGRFRSVSVARIEADGTLVGGCVSTPEELAEFMAPTSEPAAPIMK